MPRFSENLPARTNSRELAVRNSENITPQQRNQIEAATRSYLKLYRLDESYKNIVLVRDVVRECILDGIRQSREDPQITPADNLKSAFDQGVQIRQNIVSTVQSEEQVIREQTRAQRSKSFLGDLAIKDYQLKLAGLELKEIHSRAAIPNTSKLYQEIIQAREVYGLISGFLKNEIRKQYPDLEKVDLTRTQEAGFLRNVLFQWITKGEIDIDLEVIDLITKKGLFNERNSSKWSSLLREFLERTGIEPNEERVRVLRNISLQMSESLDAIPADLEKVRDLRYISSVNKELDGFYLLTNPFYRLKPLSEKVSDDEEEISIWDASRAEQVRVWDRQFIIPKAETLEYLSYQYQSTVPERSLIVNQAREALDKILTFDSLEEQNKIDAAKIERENIDRDLEMMERAVSGPVPEVILADRNKKADYFEQQTNVFDSEKRLYFKVDHMRSEIRELAVELINKYKDGRSLDPADIERFLRIELEPRWISRRVADFLRLRVRGRFAEITRAHEYFNHDYNINAKVPLRAALNTTVFDLLEMRSQSWYLDHKREQEGLISLNPEMARILLSREIARFDQLFSQRVRTFASLNRELSPFKDDVNLAQGWFLKEGSAVVINAVPQLKEIEQRINQLKSIIESQNEVFGKRSEILEWRQTRDQRYETAIANLIPQWEIDAQFERSPNITYKKREEDLSKSATDFYVDDLKSRLRSPGGGIKVATRSLLKLIPDQIHTPTELSLGEFIVDGFNSERIPNQWRFQIDRREDRENLRKFRQLLLDCAGVVLPKADYQIRKSIVSLDQVKSVQLTGSYFTAFEGIEKEMGDWWEEQSVKMTKQLESSSTILSRHPAVYYAQLLRRRKEVEVSIENMEVEKQRKIAKLIEPLERLGFIKPVEESL